MNHVVSQQTDKSIRFALKGAIYNGQAKLIANGYGKVTYSNGDIYEGFFKNGHLNGVGKLTKRYSVFTGIWINGVRVGPGKVKIKNQDSYLKGNWIGPDGVLDINDTVEIYRPDLVYKGTYPDLKSKISNGIITYRAVNGGKMVYTGSCKNLLPSGSGVLTYPNGSTYRGIFKEGLPVGFGELEGGLSIRYGMFVGGVYFTRRVALKERKKKRSLDMLAECAVKKLKL